MDIRRFYRRPQSDDGGRNTVAAFLELLCRKHDIPVQARCEQLRHYKGPTFAHTQGTRYIICDEWPERLSLSIVKTGSLYFDACPIAVEAHNEFTCHAYTHGANKMCYNPRCWRSAIERHFERIAFNRDRNYAARKIQRAFRRAISDPKYAMCRARLMREFEAL